MVVEFTVADIIAVGIYNAAIVFFWITVSNVLAE